jgi:sarcosine oxidase delta subunit
MFIINCPFCGERDQQEFKAGGEGTHMKDQNNLLN